MLTCACRVPQVGTVLQYFVERTPGSVIDTKYSGFSFHFRDADPAFGLEQAKALQTQLTKMLFHANIEVLLCPDKKYLVVHAEDINKVRRAVWAPWAVCLSRVLGPYLTRGHGIIFARAQGTFVKWLLTDSGAVPRGDDIDDTASHDFETADDTMLPVCPPCVWAAAQLVCVD